MIRKLIFVVVMIIMQALGGCDSSSRGGDPQAKLYEGRATLEGPVAGSQVLLCSLSTFIDTGMCVPVYQTYTAGVADSISIGTFNIPENVIDDAEPFYLIQIKGGVESAPVNHIPVTPLTGIPIGQYHAVLTPDQIRRGGVNVSILSEIIYQRVETLITTAPWLVATLPEEVELAAYNSLTGDVNADGEINSYDVTVLGPGHQS